MSIGEHARSVGVDAGDGVVAQAVTDVIEAEEDRAGSPGGGVASVSPIVLPSSTSQDALVEAIQQASALGVPLVLEAGTHFTKPGRVRRILIGANGLQIRPVNRPPEPPGPVAGGHYPADFSVDTQAPDDNYGLFFIPSPPTSAEIAGVTRWKLDDSGKEPFEYAVVIRGRISIIGVTVDCNMGRQNIETLPKNAAEHSAMLGFAGHGYPAPPSSTGRKRIVYVGFESVALTDVQTVNGGYADDVWFSRGYFNPNIERVDIERFSSTNRVSPRRASISRRVPERPHHRRGPVLTAHGRNLQRLQDLPRHSDVFQPSAWYLRGITAQDIGLGAEGKVSARRSDLTMTESFFLYQAGGVIRNSTLRRGSEIRLFRLDDVVFDNVTWILDPDDTGKVHGIPLPAVRRSVFRHLPPEHLPRDREPDGRRDHHQHVLEGGAEQPRHRDRHRMHLSRDIRAQRRHAHRPRGGARRLDLRPARSRRPGPGTSNRERTPTRHHPAPRITRHPPLADRRLRRT